MAAIDKIYGTREQHDTLLQWCAVHYLDALPFFYEWRWTDDGVHPITNFPESVDMWMLDHCPIDFVVERIREQYTLQ